MMLRLSAGQSHLVSGPIFRPFSGRNSLGALFRNRFWLTHGSEMRILVAGCRSRGEQATNRQ